MSLVIAGAPVMWPCLWPRPLRLHVYSLKHAIYSD